MEETLILAKSESTYKHPIPESLLGCNLLVEAASDNGLKQSGTYFSATLKVRVMENLG
jgi:hypothetical protein